MSDEKFYFICPTVNLRLCGSAIYLYRSRDKMAWDASVTTEPLFWEIWKALSSPRKLDEIFTYLNGENKENISAACDGLIECGIIEAIDTRNIRPYDDLVELPSSPTYMSSSFHLSSSRINWIDYRDGQAIKTLDHDVMDDHISEENIPSQFLRAADSSPRYELSRLIPSNLFKQISELQDVFSHKTNIINDQEISLDLINLIINNCYAQVDVVTMYATGEHIRKPVPSGGARHPIETYLVVNDVDGVEPGVYHYNVKHHRLDEIELNVSARSQLIAASTIVPHARGKKFHFSFMHTCRFERSMFRYREPRSYRVMQFDLGHIHGNLVMLSKLLGLPFSEAFSIPEDGVESCLKIDPLIESAMSSFAF